MVFDNRFGAPLPELCDIAPGARQFSPLSPGSEDIAALAPASLDNLAMLAPSGAVERRATLALALRALKPGAPLLVMAPRDRGGARLAKELREFGCDPQESAKRHHRICVVAARFDAAACDAAIAEGAPRFSGSLGLWTQPGVFAWDRIDAGSALLMRHLPQMSGKGADLGCGLGVLAHGALASPRVTGLTLVDIDRRAIELCRRNVVDSRAEFLWADARDAPLDALDFIVMNPPFHLGGAEDRALGQGFVAKAAASLRRGGVCWLVANRHLPYEAALAKHFREFSAVAGEDGYKIVEARK